MDVCIGWFFTPLSRGKWRFYLSTTIFNSLSMRNSSFFNEILSLFVHLLFVSKRSCTFSRSSLKLVWCYILFFCLQFTHHSSTCSCMSVHNWYLPDSLLVISDCMTLPSLCSPKNVCPGKWDDQGAGRSVICYIDP